MSRVLLLMSYVCKKCGKSVPSWDSNDNESLPPPNSVALSIDNFVNVLSMALTAKLRHWNENVFLNAIAWGTYMEDIVVTLKKNDTYFNWLVSIVGIF